MGLISLRGGRTTCLTVAVTLDPVSRMRRMRLRKEMWHFWGSPGSGKAGVGSSLVPTLLCSSSPAPPSPEVDLYGFGADSKGNWHHYWENNPSAGAFRKTGVHDGDFEFNLTTTLASVHKLRIFTGR
uniref:beta-D-galactosyl-(1->3)-N-acetyl-beta-D-galactosaminide alpha-2,3-sialyltransferase n=1 Tax=Molossus molossus TaxID=27622 RepID=A0A7J8DV24_MOLMO|nr:ST3 beta-galactoside alpha-2,3-sialyltransferase 1 [Molossus molossus]